MKKAFFYAKLFFKPKKKVPKLPKSLYNVTLTDWNEGGELISDDLLRPTQEEIMNDYSIEQHEPTINKSFCK